MGGLWHCYTDIELDCKLNSTHLGRSKDPPPQPNEPSGITIAVGELTSSSFPGGDVVDIAHSSLLELFTHLGLDVGNMMVRDNMLLESAPCNIAVCCNF